MGFGVCVYDSMDFSGIGYGIFGVGACVSERRVQTEEGVKALLEVDLADRLGRRSLHRKVKGALFQDSLIGRT
jgi:hypothetical protein